MPQSYDEELYIPYISHEFPHSFPPENDEEDEARSIWYNTLTPGEKLRYKHDFGEAVTRNQSVPPYEREQRYHSPEGYSIKQISKKFNFSWGSEKESERVASYFEVYKLNAEQMSRFKVDREKSIAGWEVAQSKRLGDGSKTEERVDTTSEEDTVEDEDDDEDEIYSDSDSNDSEETIRGL